jgi:hypothetical protein
MNRTIKISGKEYPFLVSAANAKANAKMAHSIEEGAEVDVDHMIDQYTSMVHMGLKDGRLTLPFWERIRTFIPSKNRLEHLIPFEEMVNMINLSGNPPQKEKKEAAETKKKP